ncbi:RNA polymerase sigma factor [Desulfonema magnum]|uniref:RNA polymerase sigma factor n=1 Tax=Desulfonema magnum TaxID=45655 RepID=A0A975BY12_9BACT|nr:RNA polymerase sigma factor [Desulfonema magnum]QTA93710.1 RNA polymerase sigma factor, sigma-70 family [Desulfonema magnum]
MSNKVNTKLWDEARLISLLKQKDEEAFRVLIQQYQTKLFGIAYSITLEKEESLDIVQEVFLKVWQNIHTFRQDAKLSTWLRRITVNQCLNWQRRWKRRFRWHHQPLESDEGGDYPELGTDDYHPESLYQKKEFEKIIWETLRKLPEDARAVFVLKEAEGLSYDEIARTLKIKRGTVSSRLFYARKKLKELLKEYMDEENKP